MPEKTPKPMTLSRLIYVCGFDEHQEFAVAAKIAKATLSRVVCGRQKPGSSILSRFAEALEHPDWEDPDVLLQLWCAEFE